MLTLLGGLSWAASALVVKLLQRKHTVDVLSLTTWQMVFGSIPLIILAALTYSGGPDWTAGFVWGLAYTVVLANAVAWFLWLYALHALPAGAAGLGTLSIPVVGVIAAWIQLGEVPTLVEGIGMILIISALAVLAAHGLLAGRRGTAAAGEEPDVARSRTDGAPGRTDAADGPAAPARYAGGVKRLFFIVMVGLWGAFIALAFVSPETLDTPSGSGPPTCGGRSRSSSGSCSCPG